MKMRLELFELLPQEIRIKMKMKNYTTQSNFALRTLCLTSGIAASLLFAATQPASAQTSSNRAGKTTQRDQVKPDVRTGGKGTPTVSPLAGDEWQVIPQILSAIPSVVGDGFGSAVAMNEAGTILVVGASDAKVDDVNAVGAVHIYTYSDRLHAWEHVQLLECPQKITLGHINGSPGLALFGWSVAISGSTIVVGAPVVTPNSGMPSLAGRVYVFQQSTEDQLWGKIFEGERVANKILGPTDPEMIGYFGGSVAIDVDPVFGIDDTRIAVGSTFRGTANQGGVYIFEGPGITPNLIVQKKFLLSDDVIAQDQFGSKVAMDGNLLVVGAQLADSDDLVNSGAAYVYRRTPNVGETIGTWSSTPEATLTPSNGASEDGFASSLSIVSNTISNTIAVGAPGTDRGVVSAGSFVVGTSYTIKFVGTTDFTLIGAASNKVGTIFTASDAGIGTGTSYVTSSSNGSAFVYRLTGGLWTLESEVFPREANAGNAFGYSLGLAMNGDQLIVGCPGYETTSPTGINVGAGFAYSRDRATNSWSLQRTDLWSPSGRPSEGIGEQCAFSQDGQKAVLGSRHNVSSGAFSTQIASNMFASTFGQTPTGVDIVKGTVPPTPDAPGPNGYATTVPTTGTGTGGTTPTTGGFGGSTAATPATPTIEDWGPVRASVIAVNRSEKRVSILTTDGNGQIETAGKSNRSLGFYDPTWQVLGVGDVNGDGSTDVLFYVPVTRKVKAWIRLGYTVAEIVTVGTATDGDRCIGISDWTGTGFDGPCFLHADGKSMSFWVIQGGAVTSKIEWAPDELLEGSWTFFTGEVTGDDRQDLVMFKDGGSSVLKVKVNSADPNSTNPVTTSTIPSPGTGYRIASAQDLDGDGSTDFLWEEESSNKLRFYFLNSDGTVRFDTPWDSNLSGWKIDQAANFTTSGGKGIMFSKDGSEVLVLTVRFEALQTLPAGRGNIRVDYSRIIGELEEGYSVLGPAREPGN